MQQNTLLFPTGEDAPASQQKALRLTDSKAPWLHASLRSVATKAGLQITFVHLFPPASYRLILMQSHRGERGLSAGRLLRPCAPGATGSGVAARVCRLMMAADPSRRRSGLADQALGDALRCCHCSLVMHCHQGCIT